MNSKCNFDFDYEYGFDDIDILGKQYFNYLTNNNSYSLSDNRVLESYVEDIDGGDNFADYCRYIFDLLEEEGYYD